MIDEQRVWQFDLGLVFPLGNSHGAQDGGTRAWRHARALSVGGISGGLVS